MYKVRFGRDNKWYLDSPPESDALLCGLNIEFPEGVSNAGGRTRYYIAGPAQVTIKVCFPDGHTETHSNVNIEWETDS